MLRRSLLAFAAIAAVGTAALTPTTASATWYGKGFYDSYGYGNYYGGYYGPYRAYYGPRYFHGRKFGYRRFHRSY
jgi:hypothetical protein